MELLTGRCRALMRRNKDYSDAEHASRGRGKDAVLIHAEARPRYYMDCAARAECRRKKGRPEGPPFECVTCRARRRGA